MRLAHALLRGWRPPIYDVRHQRRNAVDPLTDLLSSPSVRIQNPSAVADKVKALVSGGIDRLQVISDFDYTISKFYDGNGNRCLTTHMVFIEGTKEIDEALAGKLKALNDAYLPIEFDAQMTIEEKVPHMELWWRSSHRLITEAKFSRTTLRSFVKVSNILLRDGCDGLLVLLEKHKVPLILFSAGIGDIIEIFLEQRLGFVPANLHIISNMILFDQNDCAVNFSDPLIHTFNKNSSVVGQERAFFHDIRNRPNVLLLGDSLGDLHMDVGVENEGAVFKIGFLNFNVDALLPKYLDGYDIVLIQDQSMNVPLKLLRAILRGGQAQN
uniref:5'-nucleotidase n=1 Tax=Plectus sambesii TaxID=2011161 RepID=A0A914VJN8_9BILA